MARTQSQRIVAALEARGHKRVPYASDTVKLTRTLASEGKPVTFYFVGTHGSLRIGRSKTSSRPASDAFKSTLLSEASHAPS